MKPIGMNNNPENISQENFEMLERFLMGAIHEDEHARVVTELKVNESLRAQLEELKGLMSAVQEESLKDKLNSFHHDMIDADQPDGVVDKSKKHNFYLIAASIAILLCVGSLWFLNSPTNNQRLFEEYFVADPGLPTVMGNTGNYDFNVAMVDYKRGEYAIAIEKWKRLLVQQPQNDTLNYFLGAAHLAEMQPEIAIKYFDITLNANNAAFKNEAFYYMGLAYLKLEDGPKAKSYLLQSNTEKAKQLISKLQNTDVE